MADSRKRHIVIALDFGTTYSGAAWAVTDSPREQYLVNQWPGKTRGSLNGLTSEKVPTEIAFEYNESGPICLWGSEIPESMPRHQWIKLALDPSQEGVGPRLSSASVDRRDIPPPYHTSSEDLVTSYLSCMHKHLMRVLESKIGVAFGTMTWEYVVTVPAVWTDAAKAKTNSCAQKAGLSEVSNTRMISEPEAAAIHALQSSNPQTLNVGDTIVLCDAGGGTVDLITFSIVELKPRLRLKEEAPGEKLSSDPGWGRDTLEEALHRFETVAKRTFDGDLGSKFIIPVPGINDNEDLGVRRGKMKISGRDMESIFHPILKQILSLVEGQIETSSEKVSAVFLVGGFGENPYLRSFIQEKISPGIEVIQVTNSWTAVVRGALSKVVSEATPSFETISVESRMARKHYGIIVNVPFDPTCHDYHKKYFSGFYGDYRTPVMGWFVRKGDRLIEGKSLKSSWTQTIPTEKGVINNICVCIYELDGAYDPPMYFNCNIKQHVRLCPELGEIPRSKIPICRGKDGKLYYRLKYEIHAAYFSAHCEYTLWHGGQNYGTVKATYD
ncbi:hypothetical protein ANI_1_734144 [Paecilomyces variotii No. 5]|uniref:Actin-like ATPase domain-containing protein n=1 Tax=Byssochlamys spectabilis (strain No. 5 / NBRC 109023) TaxID=1356009 RepID=V5FV83_BYSSN|nr:hypothetical protein ANI_1_734144 [Paecilomyces variotii No. 5]